MHCDRWIYALLMLLCLAATARSYSIEELNSVSVTLGVDLQVYEDNDTIRDVVFELIANATTANCTQPRQDCTLVAKYYRNTGPYKRNITMKDYHFAPSQISELIAADQLDAGDGTTLLTLNLPTTSGYDYLKWTELVRIIYFSKHSMNRMFQDETGMNNVTIFVGNPTSYIAKVIEDNTMAPIAIACAILGSALILFIILVPLSNTKHCRKDLEENYDEEIPNNAAPGI